MKKNYKIITYLLLLAGFRLYAGFHGPIGEHTVDPTAKSGGHRGAPEGTVPGAHEGMTKAEVDYAAKQKHEQEHGLPKPGEPAPPKPAKPTNQPANLDMGQPTVDLSSFSAKTETQPAEHATEIKIETSVPEAQPAEHATESQPEAKAETSAPTQEGTITTHTDHTISNAFSRTNKKTSVIRGKDGKIIETKVETRDKNNNLLSVRTTRADGTVKIEVYKAKSKNADGTPSSEPDVVSEVQEIGIKKDGIQTTDVFDGAGNKLKTIRIKDNSSKFSNNKTVEITKYDAASKNPIEVKTFDSFGKIISKQTLEYDNATGKIKTVTTTDGSAKENILSTQHFAGDGKSYTTTNAKNEIIEEFLIDPTNNSKTTIKYKDSKGSATDKSSTTTIEDATGKITTHARDKNGQLIESKDTATGDVTVVTKNADGTTSTQVTSAQDQSVTTTVTGEGGKLVSITTFTPAKSRLSKSTTTIKTFEADGKSYSLKNSKGQTLEECKVDEAGVKRTTKYNKYKESKVDKSSQTTIEDPSKPDEITTEITDKQGRVTTTKTHNATTKELINSKEKINIKNLEDLTEQQFKFNEDRISKMSNNLVKINDTLGHSFDERYRDTNGINKRINNLEKQSRATSKEMLTILRTKDTTENYPDFNEAKFDLATGKERDKHLTKEELDKMNTNPDGTPMTKEQIYQRNVATKLIKSQLDSIFGTDTTSFESKFQLSDALQKEMIDAITSAHPELFTGKYADGRLVRDSQRLQWIADAQDMLMNKLSDGDATFKTEVQEDGTYKTSITNSSGAKTTRTVDNSGETIEQTFTIPGEGEAKPVIFTTLPVKASIQEGRVLSTTTSFMDTGDGTPVKLNSYEDSLTNMAYAQHKAVAIGKLMVRGSLFMAKQAVINIGTAPISLTHSATAAILTPIGIKVGAKALGYKNSQPTTLSTINKMIFLTVGNRRALVSKTGVFSKGTIGSKIIQSVKTGDITKSFQEQRDPHEEYLAWDDDIISAVMDYGRSLFPETAGEQLISNASRQSATGTSDINYKQQAMNTLGITPGSTSIASSIVSLAPTLARR